MARCTIGIGALLLIVIAAPDGRAGNPAPLAWSPDGEWISYVLEDVRTPGPIPTAWVFDGPQKSPRPRLKEPKASMRSRLWATRLGSADSVLLDDAPGPITPPGWSPDGHALVFGRIVPTVEGRGRYEVVCLEGTTRRVLFSQPIEAWDYDPTRLTRSAASWSPDGRYVAVPLVRPAGLAILRAENGRVVKSIEAASLPAWSNDGARLFYISSGDQDRLECLENRLTVTRQLAEVGQVDGPPQVARDGQSVVVLSRNRVDRGVVAPFERIELCRIGVEDGRRERITPLIGDIQSRDRSVSSTSLSQDRDGENFFTILTSKDHPCQVSWFRTRDRGVYKNFPILDPTIPATDLALNPTGGSLALRLGGNGTRGLPVVCDLETMQLTPLAPDDTARDAWTTLLLGTAGSVLREATPSPTLAGRDLERPVAMPIAGELDPGGEASMRIRRIGRLGRTILEGDARRPRSEGFEEVRFAFAYFREDFPAALEALDALDAHDQPADRRLKLLDYRAQVFIGMGDFDRARGTLGYLNSLEPSEVRRLVEETSMGPVFTDLPSPDVGWADFALGRIEVLIRELASQKAEALDDLTDHRNIDAPAPGLGLDMVVPPVPFLDNAKGRRAPRVPGLDPPIGDIQKRFVPRL